MQINSRNLILVLLVLLTSCFGSVKGDFTCKAQEGGKGSCISIKEADIAEPLLNNPNNSALNHNSNSNSDSNPNLTYLTSAPKIQINLIAPKLKDLKKLKESSFKSEGSSQKTIDSPTENRLRSEEKIGKIWFAPYIDSDSNQHSESVIYVVDEEAKWVSQGVSQGISHGISQNSFSGFSGFSNGFPSLSKKELEGGND